MRKLPLIICLMVHLAAAAQDSTDRKGKKIIVNTASEETRQSLLDDIYKYRDFLPAILVFKDQETVQAKLNYNRYFQQLFFINEKSDTMVLARPELFRMFILNTDTFYFHDKTFSYLITHCKDVNLVKNEFITLIGREKKGLYGTYSSTTSVQNEKTFTNDENQSLRWLKIDENAIYKIENRILLKDKYNNVFAASKKNVFNLFSKKEKSLKKYLEENKVNYNSEEDLVRLVEHMDQQ